MKIYLLYYRKTIKHIFINEKDALEALHTYKDTGGSCYQLETYKVTDLETLLKNPLFEKRFKRAMINKLSS